MLGGVGGGAFFSSIFHANQMEVGYVFFLKIGVYPIRAII